MFEDKEHIFAGFWVLLVIVALIFSANYRREVEIESPKEAPEYIMTKEEQVDILDEMLTRYGNDPKYGFIRCRTMYEPYEFIFEYGNREIDYERVMKDLEINFHKRVTVELVDPKDHEIVIKVY